MHHRNAFTNFRFDFNKEFLSHCGHILGGGLLGDHWREGRGERERKSGREKEREREREGEREKERKREREREGERGGRRIVSRGKGQKKREKIYKMRD